MGEDLQALDDHGEAAVASRAGRAGRWVPPSLGRRTVAREGCESLRRSEYKVEGSE